ncbi:MAG: glycosyltransferase [Alphaproteobacteria bacterium]|nr:glycosyltransferase [Alphaproteobacteria bacterium]
MKILVISSAFPPHIYGGGEVAAYNWTKLLVELGHDVSVVTSLENGETPKWGEQTPEGYKVYTLDLPRKFTYFGRDSQHSAADKLLWHAQDYFDPRSISRFKKVLEEISPDHIDVHNVIGFGFNIFESIAKRNIPVIYYLHDLNLACFKGSMFSRGKNCESLCTACKVTGYLRQKNLSKAPRVGYISPSRANLDKIRSYAPLVASSSHCAVIPNVPDDLPEELPVRVKDGTIRLLYVGRIEKIKGIDFLLQVLDQLAGHKFHLDVLGAGAQESELRTKYKDRSWVTFHGFVDKDTVMEYSAKADLFCMPSLWAETYGMVTARALQLGTPVIGSAIGGTKELVRHEKTGVLLEPGNLEDWKAEFLRIFNNPDIIGRWQDGAKDHADDYSKSSIGEKYQDLLTALHQV